MIVVLVGPPGAGKGTQADLLVKNRGFRKLSTGDALRKHIKLGTEIGKQAASVMEGGRLVSDEILFQVISEELGEDKEEKILLDGYPRNVEQAKTLQTFADKNPIASVIHLDVDREVLIERLSGRRVCPECSATYHLISNAPAKEGVCDGCGHKLVQRPDDSADKVSVRLDVYEKTTKPVLDFYNDVDLCCSVDGNGDTDSVYSKLEGCLS